MTIIPESVELHLKYVSPMLLMSWTTWGLIAVASLAAKKNMAHIPTKMQNFFEFVMTLVYSLADTAIGEKGHRYYPLFLGVFLYVLFGNLLGLIPGFTSPTSTLNTTLALGLVVFVYYQWQGIREHGIAYLAHFCGPIRKWYAFPLMALFIFIEGISHIVRPVSLAIRLFGNIFAKEILLGILALLAVIFAGLPSPWLKVGLGLAPLILRPLIIVLGVLVSIIQASVFTVLTIIYVAGAVQEQH